MQTPTDFDLQAPSWRPYQYETVQWAREPKQHNGVYVTQINEAPTGCHAKGQRVIMRDGSEKKVEDLVVGDELVTTDYQDHTHITELHNGYAQMYRVVPLDKNGTPVEYLAFTVNDKHVLTVRVSEYTRRWLDITVYDFMLLFGPVCWQTRLIQRRVGREEQFLGFYIAPLETDEYFGFTLDTEPYYLLDTGIVCHNSGKSMSALAAGHKIGQTVILTHTRALQSQYEASYPNCVVLFGRNNYPCVYEENPQGLDLTAQDCSFASKPSDCPQFYDCGYHMRKKHAREAQRAVLNYAYWLITYQKWHPALLVCDEGHNIPDIILNHVGTEINEHQRTTWRLPPFPLLSGEPVNGLFKPKNYAEPSEIARDWLDDCNTIVMQAVGTLNYKIKVDGANQRLIAQKRAAENLSGRIEACLTALATTPGEHWYINSGPGVAYYRGEVTPGFNCKPLTARYDFKRFCAPTQQQRLLIMSATIGNEAVFARELGVEEFDFYRTPAVWPAETRPVHILDVPSMGKGAADKDPGIWNKQADAISKAILSLPRHWSGIILVSRKSEANLLARRLADRGLQERIWVPPGADAQDYKPTNEQLAAWQERLEEVPNSIAVAWSFWEGVDAKESQILIAAKVPWVFRGSEYEMARERYDGAFALQRVAWQLEQGLGRVRRGDASDYNDPARGIIRTYVAIADGSWTRIKKYLSSSMLESLVVD